MGINQYDIDGKGTSLHAEIDAVQKLKDYSRNGTSTKKPKKVIGLVNRELVSKTKYKFFDKKNFDQWSRSHGDNSNSKFLDNDQINLQVQSFPKILGRDLVDMPSSTFLHASYEEHTYIHCV